MSRALVVDDEEEIAELVAEELEDHGYEVSIRNSGAMAISLLEKDKAFDIIVSDVRMPYGDGMEILSFLNGNQLKIPIIFVTGFADTSDEEALKRGARAILKKPVDFSELVKCIKRNT